MASPTREEVLLELEARGKLSPERAALVEEMRARGMIGTPKDAEKESIKRERKMSETEHRDYMRERKAKGLPVRPQPTDARLFSDAGTDQLLLQDEIAGAGAFLKQMATGDKSFIDPAAWDEAGDAYSKTADRYRAEREVFTDEYGNYALVPQIVGGLGMVGAKGGLLGQQAAKAVARGGNALANWIRGAGTSAKVGAGYGAATGFTGGEGGVLNRALGAAGGAATGAVLSPVISHAVAPAAVFALRKAIEHVGAPVVRKVAGAASRAPDAIMHRTLQRQGQTPRDAQMYLDTGEDLALYGKTQTQLPEMIVDTGPAAKRMSRAVEAVPGEGSSIAETALDLRQRGSHPTTPRRIKDPNDPTKTIANPDFMPGQNERMNDQLRRGLKVGRADYHKTKGRLVEDQKEAAGPLYDEFREMRKRPDGSIARPNDPDYHTAAPVVVDVGEILARSERADADLSPVMKRAMQTARAQFMDEDILRRAGRDVNNQVLLGPDAVVARTPNYTLNASRFQSGKEALDDMITEAVNKGQSGKVRLLTMLKNELVEAADAASTVPVRKGGKIVRDPKTKKPVYRSVYQEARDAYSEPEGLLDALAKGRTFMKGDSEVTAAEYKALSTGEKRMFRVGMAQQARVDLGKKVTGADRVAYFDRPNVQEVLGSIMSKNEFQRLAALHSREGAMTASRQATKGTRTTPLREDIEDLNWLGRQAEAAKQSGGMFGYTLHLASEAVKRLTRMREEDSLALARMLFERDRVKQRQILQRIEKKYGKPRAQRGLAAAVREVRRYERAQLQNQGIDRASSRIGGIIAGDSAAMRPDASPTQ